MSLNNALAPCIDHLQLRLNPACRRRQATAQAQVPAPTSVGEISAEYLINCSWTHMHFNQTELVRLAHDVCFEPLGQQLLALTHCKHY